ncbi:hypothetical protein GobsT_75300 [Gemmata obscuriglobus]|uniref:Phytase-like domain-containing protein n=1 Tax=Gemmata obscuriglobus TaxID=114 RepID=A0A2Z3HHX4_9BACT|nr:esterase-like activity of phytase family protein [Gemmata obscuriglobus]AWM41424.1 hypothetical protein C1280_33455 [Gemmata obscuriglobus]QEG32672.1 hypothetical protein GobsT_75300 [Gemmata obscuriglobus]VTS12028.1 Uncharacterized protein OS=Desulfobacca acetoxidans (strain ATCC 700848 / DSM 11109 / ASRB2) GN=Desac_1860 PE=4 SV=1: Phytase-like [Gemmata obscuriglobus UQM 2246]
MLRPRTFTACLLLAACASAAQADVALIGVGTIPGDAADLSGLKGKTSDGTPHNRLGGMGSAIAYTGQGNEYLLVSDRGPKDGATDFVCRWHQMEVGVAPGAKTPVTLKLTATTLLTNESGKRFVGSLDAFEHTAPAKNLRLDPEGARVGRDGTVHLSDEYGPGLYAFNQSGTRVASLPMPAHFLAPKPGKMPADELPPKSASGRQPNRGMEGLAISPDGKKLFGIMQSPLIQDGALDDKNNRTGLNCRILELDLTTQKSREFVYPLENAGYGVNEILAVNDHEFLVLERDGKGGNEAEFKRLYLIDLTDATDVSAVAALPAKGLPGAVKSVKKKPFLDLLAKKYGIAGPECPEKFEGLAFGPDLPDGRRLLLVTADNDFLANKPFRVYAFAVDRGELPGFRPQQFDPQPLKKR